MKARVIGFYLPQFHPTPENDKFWGKGFTEWTNVAKARPLFRGHYQPRIPADLGFYDLRLPEVREEQAELARQAGVEGFCYWHYWFGNGKQLLERPFNEVVASGKPNFPFCLAWANHDWKTGTWNGNGKDEYIAQQLYPGAKDNEEHFYSLLTAFKDHRYITVDGKLLFLIYDPYDFVDVEEFMEQWNELAAKNGLSGFHFVAMTNNTSTIRKRKDGVVTRGTMNPNLESSAEVYNMFLNIGFDGICSWGKSRAEMISDGKYKRAINFMLHKHLPFLPAITYDYAKVMKHCFAPEDAWDNVYPTIMPQWDRSPRAATYEGVYVNATPENFARHIREAVSIIKDKPAEHKILFLRSWNEWAEGNYVEPDLKYGHGFLDAIRNEVKD